jgi:hypothetical protein
VTFDGATYSPGRDLSRLKTQMDRVTSVMLDGHWHTLQGLAIQCGGSDASVSARLRDLRKSKFGGFEVERRYVDNGVWEYRLNA